MVECHLAKVDVASPNLVYRSTVRVELNGRAPAFQAGYVGPIPITRSTNAPLAQLVEHLTLNQGVPGSSP